MTVFHGGCHGCSRKCESPVCVKCRYFEADWSLPDLNTQHATQERATKSMRDRVRVLATSCAAVSPPSP